jgi:drug/metabolite transporter (DMT)-like permease
MNFTAVGLALASAVLFGLSAPAAKLLLRASEGWTLAGLLYSGAGIGLLLVHLARRGSATRGEAQLSRKELPWLAAAVLAGGVIGPVLLLQGLSHLNASSASLLLTLEGVLTALLAWFVFRENFDRRIAIGMACILAGAVVLSWGDDVALHDLIGPLAIAGACLAWAIDNNLTRKVSLSDPVQIAMIKGLVAGPVSLLIGRLMGQGFPPPSIVALSGLTGFLGYGVSLVLFVTALRHLGSARTAAYYSIAPFVGALASVALFGDAITPQLALAGVLMAIGIWLHLTERHAHEHLHEALEHTHRHSHDAHHDHLHEDEAGVDRSRPHSHPHVHGPIRHTHAHVPDSHHRHVH